MEIITTILRKFYIDIISGFSADVYLQSSTSSFFSLKSNEQKISLKKTWAKI